MELKEGKEYIVKSFGNIKKIKVIEKTETSVFVENLDVGTKFRCNKRDFERDYIIMEELGGNKQLLLG